jgi:hypothetical protein
VNSPQTLTTTFADVGGGVASTGLVVDGQILDETPVPTATCRIPYRTRVPCPLTFVSRLQFDPAEVSDGTHALQVFARDSTRVNVVASAPVTVVTSFHAATNASGAGTLADARLTLGVRSATRVGQRPPEARPSTTVHFGAVAVAVGRLVDAAGQPVIRVPLRVATAVDRGLPAFAQLAIGVVTDADGRFQFAIPPGPSRRLRVSYFARTLDLLPAAEAEARLNVPTRASFRMSSHTAVTGERLLFRGRIAGSYRPSGLHVELQGRRGQTYVTLRTSAARPDGTYRLTYRLSRGARGRFIFRLKVPSDARFPYSLGFSRPLVILVR